MNPSTIFINAGHGLGDDGKSYDAGAVANGITERDQTVEISRRVKNKLEGRGYEVIEIGIAQNLNLIQCINRINLICNNNKLTDSNSLLLSIHINAGGGTGIETWYYGNDAISRKFCECVGDTTAETMKMFNRGAKSEFTNRWGQLGIIHDTIPLAGLIECGFIDNINDIPYIKNYDLMAEGIVKGIGKFLGKDFSTIVNKPKPAEVVPTPSKKSAEQVISDIETLIKDWRK